MLRVGSRCNPSTLLNNVFAAYILQTTFLAGVAVLRHLRQPVQTCRAYQVSLAKGAAAVLLLMADGARPLVRAGMYSQGDEATCQLLSPGFSGTDAAPAPKGMDQAL